MDLFVSYKNVGKFYKNASSLKKICLETEQGARTTTQTQNVPEIDVGSATLRVVGASAATAAAATAAGFAGYNYWKNYERIRLRKVYKKLLDNISNQNNENIDQKLEKLDKIAKEIQANPTNNLKELYGTFNQEKFFTPQKIPSLPDDTLEHIRMNKVIVLLNGLEMVINDTYSLKYAKLNYCKTSQNMITYMRLKDNEIVRYILNSTTNTLLEDIILKCNNILLILIGERYEALSTCFYESEEVPKDSDSFRL